MVRNILLSSGHDVFTITSDFCHANKESVFYSENNIKTFFTFKYFTNTGFSRLLSHFLLTFSFILWYLKNKNKFECVYVTSPFAICSMFVGFFGRSKLIIDVIDFWPDSLPFPNAFLYNLITFFWHKINYYSYKNADYIISLSSNFLDLIPSSKKKLQIGLGTFSNFVDYKCNDDIINLVYVGNIGNLYDFTTLIDAINLSHNKFHLHLVGAGDVLIELIDILKYYDIDYKYYGCIYDSYELKKIMSQCQIGFNGFKGSTNASFSYKALTYFSYGLPIINSMKGDLSFIINKYNLGYNYLAEDPTSLSFILNNISDLMTKHSCVRSYFNNHCNHDVISKDILKVFNI